MVALANEDYELAHPHRRRPKNRVALSRPAAWRLSGAPTYRSLERAARALDVRCSLFSEEKAAMPADAALQCWTASNWLTTDDPVRLGISATLRQPPRDTGVLAAQFWDGVRRAGSVSRSAIASGRRCVTL